MRELVESLKVSDAIVTHSSLVAHNDVLERSVELVSSAGMKVSLVHTDHHVVDHDYVYLVPHMALSDLQFWQQLLKRALRLSLWCKTWSYGAVFMNMIKNHLNCHLFQF